MINPKEFHEGLIHRTVHKLSMYRQHPERLRAQTEAYFKEFDADNSGSLDLKELRMFLIALFKQYKLHLPLTEEFVVETAAEMDKDGDGLIDLDELNSYMDTFLKTLLDVFENALKEVPEKMIRVESFTMSELEEILKELKVLEDDQEKLKEISREYYLEFDADKSGLIDKNELTVLLKEFFIRRGLNIPFDKKFIDAWFLDLDVDKSGNIDLNELIEMMSTFNTMLVRMYSSAIEAKKHMK